MIGLNKIDYWLSRGYLLEFPFTEGEQENYSWKKTIQQKIKKGYIVTYDGFMNLKTEKQTYRRPPSNMNEDQYCCRDR